VLGGTYNKDSALDRDVVTNADVASGGLTEYPRCVSDPITLTTGKGFAYACTPTATLGIQFCEACGCPTAPQLTVSECQSTTLLRRGLAMVLTALSLVTKTANAVSSSGAMLLQLQQGVFRLGRRQAVRGMQTALSRNVVLPRLLDTLSATFQQSSTRMDGLINQMTQELEKVGVSECQLGRSDTPALLNRLQNPVPCKVQDLLGQRCRVHRANV